VHKKEIQAHLDNEKQKEILLFFSLFLGHLKGPNFYAGKKWADKI